MARRPRTAAGPAGRSSTSRAVRCAVAGAAALGAALLTRRMTQTWGTLAGELDTELPGDDLLPGASVVATRAIRIAAAPRDVWPWLVQLGYGRGGFYSYDALERLVGLDITSADTVVEQWQGLAVGDPVWLAEGVGLRVAALEERSHLVLQGDADLPGAHAAPYDFTWAFVLRPIGTGTRLLVRERYLPHGPGSRVMVEAVQPVSFLMSQKMLRGIRDRATSRPA